MLLLQPAQGVRHDDLLWQIPAGISPLYNQAQFCHQSVFQEQTCPRFPFLTNGYGFHFSWWTSQSILTKASSQVPEGMGRYHHFKDKKNKAKSDLFTHSHAESLNGSWKKPPGGPDTWLCWNLLARALAHCVFLRLPNYCHIRTDFSGLRLTVPSEFLLGHFCFTRRFPISNYWKKNRINSILTIFYIQFHYDEVYLNKQKTVQVITGTKS